MLKNQLVIYRNFATQQYIYDIHEINEEIKIPISSSTNIEHITSNYPFTIKNHQILIHPIIQTTPTISTAIDETTEKDIHPLIQNLEIIIKYPKIKWQTVYNFFKNTNTLICYASITNQHNFDIHTKDIKVVFRSVDHEYDIIQPKNLTVDIPTFYTQNILQIDLNEVFDKPFVICEHANIEIWRKEIICNEIYQHHIMDNHQYYCDSFLVFDVPFIMLPGNLEIYERTESNDILSLGSSYIKLYKRGDKLKIYFPKNNFIKLKNELTCNNHSFFIQKSIYTLKTKIKKQIEGKAIIHFYIEKNGIIKPSKEPTIQDKHYMIWEVISENKETIFDLTFTKNSS